MHRGLLEKTQDGGGVKKGERRMPIVKVRLTPAYKIIEIWWTLGLARRKKHNFIRIPKTACGILGLEAVVLSRDKVVVDCLTFTAAIPRKGRLYRP
jgi:hypothetical protein